MKLNTGKQEFVLEFDEEHVEKIYFNPLDPELSVRLKRFGKLFQDKKQEIGDIELDENGNPINKDDIDAFEEITHMVYKAMDEAFCGNIADKVFKYCSMLAITNVETGEMFLEQFMNAIGIEINERISKATPTIKARVEQHIGKYR